MFKRPQPSPSDDAGPSKRRRTLLNTVVTSTSNNTLRHIRLVEKANGKLAQRRKYTKKPKFLPTTTVDPDDEVDVWINEPLDEPATNDTSPPKPNKKKKKKRKTVKVSHACVSRLVDEAVGAQTQ